MPFENIDGEITGPVHLNFSVFSKYVFEVLVNSLFFFITRLASRPLTCLPILLFADTLIIACLETYRLLV